VGASTAYIYRLNEATAGLMNVKNFSGQTTLIKGTLHGNSPIPLFIGYMVLINRSFIQFHNEQIYTKENI
jgi:hypothetical protein